MSVVIGSIGMGGCGGGSAPAGGSSGVVEESAARGISLGSVPAPAPAPALTPAPAPAPAPTPSVGGAPALDTRALDLSLMVSFQPWHEWGPYQRYQRSIVLSGGTGGISVLGLDLLAGGRQRAFLGTKYSLLFDGIVVATLSPASGTTTMTFAFDLSTLAEGWHLIDVDCGSTGETCPPFYAYVSRGGAIRTDAVPLATSSYDVAHYGRAHRWALLPNGAALGPISRPLPARDCPVFSDTLTYPSLFRENMVPVREGDIHRITMLDNGAPSTFNFQAYFWSGLTQKIPGVPLLDGPRGVGTLQMPTMIAVDRHGGVYFADPWRIGRISTDGTIRTRCGYRHRAPRASNYSAVNPNLELLGDWSAIPAERRGFHEIWGFAWDKDSLALNMGAPTQINPLTGVVENPHAAGPRLFVADTQRNRVCLLTFPADDFNAEPAVTEFLSGLQDPWDVACDAGVLYVSERLANRIAAYDAKTGAFLRVVVSGAALARVDINRQTWINSGVTLAQVQAQNCVFPEGLAFQDGWLYFGSKVMQQVRRVNLASGELQVVCSPKVDANSNFMKIAVGDGTFGPRGAVFTCTWSNAYYGMPQAFKPDGTPWPYMAFDYVPRGKSATGWSSLGYASAVGVGMGRMYAGSSEEGLVRISRALPSDLDLNTAKLVDGTRTRAAFDRGSKKWVDTGFELLHGQGGYGHFGYALPWSVDSDIDVYLTVNGHTKP